MHIECLLDIMLTYRNLSDILTLVVDVYGDGRMCDSVIDVRRNMAGFWEAHFSYPEKVDYIIKNCTITVVR